MPGKHQQTNCRTIRFCPESKIYSLIQYTCCATVSLQMLFMCYRIGCTPLWVQPEKSVTAENWRVGCADFQNANKIILFLYTRLSHFNSRMGISKLGDGFKRRVQMIPLPASKPNEMFMRKKCSTVSEKFSLWRCWLTSYFGMSPYSCLSFCHRKIV